MPITDLFQKRENEQGFMRLAGHHQRQGNMHSMLGSTDRARMLSPMPPMPPTPVLPPMTVLPLLSILAGAAVWSIGEHGPTRQLVSSLQPLLLKYNVTAYVCGHDHSMQHIRPSGSTLDYFVVGAGHLTDASKSHEDSIPPGSLKYWYAPEDLFHSHGAFATITVSDHVNVTFVDTTGKEIYSAVSTSPRSV